MRLRLFFIITLLAASAQAQTLDQTFKDWSVFKQGTSCYIASAPKKSSGTFKKRGQPYLLIVSKGTGDEVNASSGYPYAAKSEVVAMIGGRQFKLFTQGAVAWAYDAAQDAQLVAAMKQGASLVLRGKSIKGTTSEDTYSLNGISDAYTRMKALCK